MRLMPGPGASSPLVFGHLQRAWRLRDFIAKTLNVYFSPGVSTTAASVVSSRKVKVSRKYSSTTVREWLK